MNPLLAGISALLIFSVGTLVLVLTLEVPPFQFLAITFFIGAISIFSFEGCHGKNIIKAWQQPPSTYLVVLLGIGFYNFILLMAFHDAPAFEVNILNYLWPIFIVVLSTIIHKTQLDRFQILGIILGFAGVCALFFPNSNTGVFEQISYGHILAILGALSWAFYSVTIRNHHYPSVFIAPIMMISALAAFISHLIFEETVLPSWSVLLIIFLFSSARFCYVLWDYAMRHGDQILLSSLSYFTPLLSTILFILFGFKPTSPFVIIGSALIIIGCLSVNADKIMKLRKPS